MENNIIQVVGTDGIYSFAYSRPSHEMKEDHRRANMAESRLKKFIQRVAIEEKISCTVNKPKKLSCERKVPPPNHFSNGASLTKSTSNVFEMSL